MKNSRQPYPYTLHLTWMYPDLMSTYGDRGNILVIKKRCEWRGIKLTVLEHGIDSDSSTLLDSDMVVMGGAQDRQQKLVSDNLQKKAKTLKRVIENGIPGLFICGAYQFLGKYYRTSDGTTIPGLSIFDSYTVHSGDQKKRIIGNIVTKWGNKTLVGFENHGGRTYLGKMTEPFAIVEKGGGNNGEDSTEGIVYKNSVGTYLHGPILPKNPTLADWLISTALKVKYQKEIKLERLEDELENKAREVVLKTLQLI